MGQDWLNLSETAKLLGVHPSTVRNWADQGRLPVHRTQGGHRRFRRADVELWTESQQVKTPQEVELVVQSALGRTRFQISEGRLEAEPWFKKLDREAKDQYRYSGRELLRRMNAYLTSDDKTGQSHAWAAGSEYAGIGHRYGLSSLDTVRAFLFFRDMILDSMISVYESAYIHSPQAWGDMLRKINAFTDQVLLALLEKFTIYEAHLQ